ncbi:MAG: dTMP kinase [Acidobacteria bacterium]|nr:dTMP kinase [Acidobacteriota bacterium]
MSLAEKLSGKFLTFEGIEGSGKTTQVQLFQEYLTRQAVPFVLTREPGGTAFGREVRKILLDQHGPERAPVAELLLYLADRYQHLREVIEPSLKSGLCVLADRYHDATVAYQGYGRGIELSFIEELWRVLGFRDPDLTVVVDLPPERALQRARSRNSAIGMDAAGRFEAEDLEFHRRVSDGYRKLSRRYPGRVKLIEGAGSAEEVHSKVVRVVEAHFS